MAAAETGPLVGAHMSIAGAGSTVGSRFEDLAEILQRIDRPNRTAVCFDTCHVFAAGYDLRARTAYRRTMRTFDRVLGLDRIRVFHVNDCRGDLGGHLDRHAHIGRGRIGTDAFRFLMTDRRFSRLPKIIETPKHEDGTSMDPVNLNRLRRLARKGRRTT